MSRNVLLLAAVLVSFAFAPSRGNAGDDRPHIILVMADDMGWGQTGYRGHPILKTPNLDAMAANGLRFERFYAGAPNCSPTRATVLTGRSNDRCGVHSPGFALRRQEKTLVQALRAAGYFTGLFGKWHLNGFSGPGVPILKGDTHHPGHFGFDAWLAVTNFFDRDPILSRAGVFEEHKGDSSEIVVDEALKHIEQHHKRKQPLFTVIWFGTPHSPFRAAPDDAAPFADLPKASAEHHGELVAMDRAIGKLRARLRELGLADNTILWFCSDNGGLPEVQPNTTGGLRGFKNSLYEGGLRVPAILEWPAKVKPRITHYPACTVDMFPTIADLVKLPATSMLQPIDGISLVPIFDKELPQRSQPLLFRHNNRGALIDHRYKIVCNNLTKRVVELYDLPNDPKEATDLAAKHPDIAKQMGEKLWTWNETVEKSLAGKDYPEGQVNAGEPRPQAWSKAAVYQPFLSEWANRPEYKAVLSKKKK